MNLISSPAGFNLISTFSNCPDFDNKDMYAFWLRKAGLFKEAEELESLPKEDLEDLFLHFLEVHEETSLFH